MSKKLRNECQEKSKTNRYKVVNCLRPHNVDTIEVQKDCNIDLQSSSITILDVEPDINRNDGIRESKSEEGNYVYDLYYTSSDYFGDTELEEQEHIRLVCSISYISCVFLDMDCI